MNKINVAIYARVSTLLKHQNIKNQIEQCQQYVDAREDYKLYKIYFDEGISGAKERRPGLDSLVADAKRNRFHKIVCVSISRLARDVRHALNLLEELSCCKVEPVFLNEALDFGTPIGKAALTMLHILNQLERELRKESIRNALAARKLAAEKAGTKFRIGRPSVQTPELVAEVIKYHQQGNSVRQIELLLDKKASRGTIQRIITKSKNSSQN